MGPRPPWSLFSSHTLTPALDSSGNPFEGSIGPASAADWLFAVVDEDGTVVLSATSGQTVYVGILTFTISGGFAAVSIDWVAVTTATTVNDIWHIFAHGSHWISFSYAAFAETGSEADMTLLNFTTADITAAVASGTLTPTSTVVYSQTDTTALVLRTDGGYSTNDHFISATPQGIALGLWRGAPGYAASKYLGLPVDPAVVTLFELSIGPVALAGTSEARGPSTIAATGSAQTLVGTTGFGVWHPKLWMCVPTDIEPDTKTQDYAENTLEILSMSPTQSDAASEGAIIVPGYNLQMGTFVRLANEDFVVVYKSVPAGSADYPSTGGARQQDWGSVEVKVLYPTLGGEWDSQTFLQAASNSPTDKMANRPHCVQWGPYLITVWVEATYSSTDGLVPGNGFLRIDELVGVP